VTNSVLVKAQGELPAYAGGRGLTMWQARIAIQCDGEPSSDLLARITAQVTRAVLDKFKKGDCAEFAGELFRQSPDEGRKL
jgi:hypothetical protein